MFEQTSIRPLDEWTKIDQNMFEGNIVPILLCSRGIQMVYGVNEFYSTSNIFWS